MPMNFLFLTAFALLSRSVNTAPVAQELSARADYPNTGQATFFTPGLGSCGWYSKDSDSIVALSSDVMQEFMGPNGWQSNACGHHITVYWQGKSIDATVVDSCPTCEGSGSIDLSPGAISQLDPNYQEDGVLYGISWEFVGPEPAKAG